MRTATGGAAASISSAVPSTQATGPPWLAVCVAKMSLSCFNQARMVAASATSGTPRFRHPSTGSALRTQALRPNRRRIRIKPSRSRRGLVRPLKSKSPGASWCQFQGIENSTLRIPMFFSHTNSRSQSVRGYR